MKKRIWFYLSEYGYGHSIRCFELIKALLKKDPNLDITIRNKIDDTIVKQNREFLKTVKTGNLKIGMKGGGIVHADQFGISLRELNDTADLIYEFFKNEKSDLISSEVKLMSENKPDLIIGDIPSYTFDIAEKSKIPSVGFSDYLWNIIYEPYIDSNPKFDYIAKSFLESYSKMDLLIHYPPKTPIHESIKSVEVEFVCRRQTRSKREVRKLIGIPDDKMVVMLVIRDFRLKVPKELIEKYPEITFMSAQEIENIQRVEPQKFGIGHVDLMNASDLIISKLGYSLIGDLLPNQIPVLLVDRQDFAEDQYLIETLKQHIPYSFKFRMNDFLIGDWGPYIDHFLHHKDRKVPKDYRINGAEQAAHIIMKKFLGR